MTPTLETCRMLFRGHSSIWCNHFHFQRKFQTRKVIQYVLHSNTRFKKKCSTSTTIHDKTFMFIEVE